MKHLLFVLFALLSTSAFATSNQDHTCQGGHNCNTTGQGGQEQGQTQGQAQGQEQAQLQGQSQSSENNNTNLNLNENNSSASSNAVSISEGGAGGNAYASGGEGGSAIQGQSQSSDNSNSSNNSSSQSTSLTFEGTGEAQHTNKYGNNVSAYAPAIYSSSACTAGGLSAGIAGMGFGASIGGAKQDPQCQIRENARILSGLDTSLAILYLCRNGGVDIGAVLGADCKVAPAPPIVIPEPEPEPEIPVQVITEPVKG